MDNAEVSLGQREAQPATTAQDEAVARYLLKHPHMAMFVQAPSTAVLRLAVDVYYLVNRFQKVMEYHVGR